MTWFKVDDNLAFHRKTVVAGNAAMGLWVRAGSWCAQQLTDGIVPNDMIASLGNTAQAKRLVAAGLWERVEGGYRFWQWNEAGRQPTREQVEQDRAAAKTRMQRVRTGKRSSGEHASERTAEHRPNEHRTSPHREAVDNSVNDALTQSPVSVNEVTNQRGGVQAPTNAQPPNRQATGSGSPELHEHTDRTSPEVRSPRPVPSRPEGTGVPVDQSSSVRTTAARADDDDRNPKIDKQITEQLAELTGRAVSREHAAKTRRQILDGRTVNDPAAYVAACIRAKPRDFLPADGAPPSTPVRQALAEVMPDAAAGPPAADPPDSFRAARDAMRGIRPA
ncbi:MAG: hypothetical protein ACRDP6_48875 [Actinoallomurus sp.]